MARKGLERRTELARGAPPKRGRAKKTADRVGGGEVDWSPEVRGQVLARSGGRCEIGGPGCLGDAVNVHHRKLRAHGDHRFVNAIAVCAVDHDAIHRGFVQDEDGTERSTYDVGWLVHGTDDPALIPWLRRGEWVGPDLPSRAPD